MVKPEPTKEVKVPVKNPQPGQIVTIDEWKTVARWLAPPFWYARIVGEPDENGKIEIEILSDWTLSPRPYPHRPDSDRRPREIVEVTEGETITIPVERIAATKDYNEMRWTAHQDAVAQNTRDRIRRERKAKELAEACKEAGLKVALDGDTVTVTSTAAEILELIDPEQEPVES